MERGHQRHRVNMQACLPGLRPVICWGRDWCLFIKFGRHHKLISWAGELASPGVSLPYFLEFGNALLDISNVPELLRIAEEVRITHQPRILRRESEDLAILMPVTPSSQRRLKRELTESDYQAFLSAAGSWSGLVDSDKLITDIYESRRLSSKPPVEL